MMNLTLEQTMVGELILNPDQIQSVRDVLSDSSFFHDSVAAKFYESILSCYDKHGTADIFLIEDEVKFRGLTVGELQDWASLVSYNSVIVKRAHRIAEIYLKKTGTETVHNLFKEFENNPNVFEVIDESITTLSSIRSQFKKEHSVPLSIVAKETCLAIDKYYEGKDDSIKFGFTDIDKITGGMSKGNLVVYAALQKRGKSTMMLQTMFYNALRGVPCLIFSTEMKRDDLMLRYAMIKLKINWVEYIQRKLPVSERERLKRYARSLGEKCVIDISDRVTNVIDIISESERAIQNKGIKLIAVDYIQRVVPVNKKSNENREREIASIVTGLKNIAFKNNISLIALSQLNDDLRARESRSIEQEMDKMITVNGEDKDEKTPDGKDSIIGIRVQQRMGASANFGDTKMIYDKGFGYWKSYLNRDEEFIEPEPPQTEPIF